MNSGLTSNQQRHTETGPRFKVSFERPEKRGIGLAIPALVVIHYTTAAPMVLIKSSIILLLKKLVERLHYKASRTLIQLNQKCHFFVFSYSKYTFENVTPEKANWRTRDVSTTSTERLVDVVTTSSVHWDGIISFEQPDPGSNFLGAPVAQLVKRWPTDLADRVRSSLEVKPFQSQTVGWLVIWVLPPFETVFQSISSRLPRGRKKIEKIHERKNIQTTPTRTHCKRYRPLPYYYPN